MMKERQEPILLVNLNEDPWRFVFFQQIEILSV